MQGIIGGLKDGEYDGSEWFEFKTYPTIPDKIRKINRIINIEEDEEESMDIEVGEYVRLKQGIIAKVSNINDFRETSMKFGIDANYFKDIVFVGENDIVKHSKNIIDLIEAGDFVNGYRICGKNKYSLEDDESYTYREEDIKTILTHQQYETNYYKLED